MDKKGKGIKIVQNPINVFLELWGFEKKVSIDKIIFSGFGLVCG